MRYARGILLAPVVLGILAPLFLKLQMYWASENIYHFLSAICHQASSRSFWIFGAPMGICARNTGIYMGLFLASCNSILNRKWQGRITIGFIFISPLLVEKAALSSFATTNIIRLIVGILAGFGIGLVLFYVFKELFSWLIKTCTKGGKAMKKINVSLLVLFLFLFSQMHQFANGEEPKEVSLSPGTMVILKVNETVKGDMAPGTSVNLSVLHDVVKNGYVLIKAGTPAIGTVASAEKAKMIGREGKVTISVERTQAVDGQEVFLQGSMSGTGEERLVTSVVVSTLVCPLALLMKGGEAEIPAGAELRTFVASEVKVKVPVK